VQPYHLLSTRIFDETQQSAAREQAEDYSFGVQKLSRMHSQDTAQ